MKKLKIDTLDYSKIYSKFKIIPFLSILFVIAYISLPFIKMIKFDGGVCSAISFFKRSEWIIGVYFILPQIVILFSFVPALINACKRKAFVLLDLSSSIAALFGILAIYSVIFMSLTKMIDGAMTYVQWLILIPIIYLTITTLVNFVCCLLSGKTKLPISILICHCVCVVFFILLLVIISSTPFIHLGEQDCGIFVDGKLILFNATFISVYGASKMLLTVWGITGLAAIALVYLIEKISDIVGVYKISLLYKNDDVLELLFKDQHTDWKEYVQTHEGKLKIESYKLKSCRDDLNLKSGITLAIIGLLLLVVRMNFINNIGIDALQVFISSFNNISPVACWTTLLVGVAIIAITIITKRITYKKMVKIEEKTDNNDTIDKEKQN